MGEGDRELSLFIVPMVNCRRRWEPRLLIAREKYLLASNGSKEAAASRKGPKLYGLRLAADDLRRLIAALGSDPPEDDQKLVEALRGLLSPSEAGP